jgi:hypothetical protein
VHPQCLVSADLGDLSNEVTPEIGRGIPNANGRPPRVDVKTSRRLIQCGDPSRVRGGEADEFIAVGAETGLRHQRHWEVIGEPAYRGGVGAKLFIE